MLQHSGLGCPTRGPGASRHASVAYSGPLVSVRTAVSHRRLNRTCRAAADDEHHAAASQSACPFANVVSDKHNAKTSTIQATAVRELSGNGWRVLPQGNAQGLPEVEGNFCWNPLLGEYGQLEKQGAGAFMLERMKKYGPVFNFMLGRDKMTAVVDYETIRSLLQQGDSKVMVGWMPPALYAMLGEGSRKGLEDPETRVFNRKMMAPGFTKEALRGYLHKIEAICVKQLDAWAARGTPVDLRAEGKALSFEFSTELLVDFAVPEEQKTDIKRKLDALFQGMFAPPINLPGTRFSKGLQAKAELREDIIKIINSPEGRSKDKAESSVFQYNLEAKKRTSTTDGNLTDQQMAEAGIGLIIAGNDTSGLGMTALLAILPQFPEVMEKLRQEQKQVIAKHGTQLTTAVLDAMPYADAVVREVLRVAPPSAQVMRRTVYDMEILGKFVPAGSRLFLSSLMGQVLTDPKMHPHITPQDLQDLGEGWYTVNTSTLKQEFHPERWLQQSNAGQTLVNQGLTKPSGLLTFSVGPHICLGLSLFMHEAKVLLALLGRDYVLESEEPEQLGFEAAFVTQLKAGSKVRFSKLPAGTPAEAPVPVAR